MSARSLQGRLAAETRYRPDVDHTDLKRDLKVAQLEDYISRVVAEAPPLTVEQRSRLALLLAPGDPNAAA